VSRRGELLLLRAIVAGGIFLLVHAIAFAAEDQANTDQSPARSFDIPAQPLEDALYAFDVATGIEVFVDGATVAGRRSVAIKGMFTPLDALRALLAGTGLDARSIGADAVTLYSSQPQITASSLTYRDYSALVQTAVVRALCTMPDVRPGSYRVAMQLWLAPTGVVLAASLLSSTGDAERDRRIRDVLAGLPVGRAPPPALPQPVIMVILPRAPQDSGDCS
jgi:hypothetical protein